MADIRKHAWFLENLPTDLVDEKMVGKQVEELQSLEVIMQLISEAKTVAPGLSKPDDHDIEDLDSDPDLDLDLDVDSSGEVVYAFK